MDAASTLNTPAVVAAAANPLAAVEVPAAVQMMQNGFSEFSKVGQLLQ